MATHVAHSLAAPPEQVAQVGSHEPHSRFGAPATPAPGYWLEAQVGLHTPATLSTKAGQVPTQVTSPLGAWWRYGVSPASRSQEAHSVAPPPVQVLHDPWQGKHRRAVAVTEDHVPSGQLERQSVSLTR